MIASVLWFHLTLAVAVQVPVQVEITGNDSIKTRDLLTDLRPWIQDLEAAPRDEAIRSDLAEEMRQIYIAAGFPDAEVETLPLVSRGNGWIVKFRVKEGTQRQVGRVEFRAASPETSLVFSDNRLRTCLNWSQSGLLSLVGQGRVVFTEASLRSTRERLLLLYRLEGYLDADVKTSFSERVDEQGRFVDVVIVIDPGAPHRVGNISIDDPDRDQILAQSDLRTGMPFTPRLPIEIEKRIERYFAERGYFEAQVRVTTTAGDDQVRHLDVSVLRGPIARIFSITLEGNERTRKSWVRAHLPFGEGDLYRKTALEEGRGRLLRSGLFEHVTIRVEPRINDTSELDVTVEMKEKPVLQLGTTLGFGSYQLGRLGAEIRRRNLFGRGIEGWLSARASFKSESVDSGFRFPIQAGDDLSFSVDGGYLRFVEPSFVRQQSRITGAFSDRFQRFNTWRIGYEIREELVLDAEDSIPDELDEDSRSALVFVKLSRDTRNSLLEPTRGFYATFRTEHAAKQYGSSLDFVRLTGRTTYVWTPIEHWTIVSSGQAGWLHSTTSQRIPLGERFFLGGARSFRAFRERELGPRDAGNEPVGAEAYLIGNLELRYPIWKAIGGTAFFEAASAVQEDEDLARKGDRYGAGGGLLLDTPLGPFRVDMGFNLNPKSGEDEWAIHFLLGHPF